MAEKETKKPEPAPEIGLVSYQGEVGYGMNLPDGTNVDLTNVDKGTAQILEYLVKTIHEIRKQM